jgi:hypothetical protein
MASVFNYAVTQTNKHTLSKIDDINTRIYLLMMVYQWLKHVVSAMIVDIGQWLLILDNEWNKPDTGTNRTQRGKNTTWRLHEVYI